MSYCSRCGVEVEARAEACPLCDAPIQRFDEPPNEPCRYPEITPVSERQVRHLVWMVSTAVLLSAGLTMGALDYVLNQRFAWSLYPLTGVGVLWLLITLIVLFARRPIFVIVGQAVATAGLLVAVDLFDRHLDWFMSLALPIVALITGATLIVWLVTRLSHWAPALIAASVLFSCACGSVGLDLLISAHLGAMHLSWSFIVLGAVVPPFAFLLYFQFHLRHRIDLVRFLHT